MEDASTSGILSSSDAPLLTDYHSIQNDQTDNQIKKKTKYTHHHLSVFLLTFCSYALYHATRKTFSNVKFTMGQEWSPTNTSKIVAHVYDHEQWNSQHVFSSVDDSKIFMGSLDLGFLLAYAAGLIFYGAIGDRFNLRYVLTMGMMTSAITVFAFGCISQWASYEAKWYYMLVWILNGFFQATGWPCVVSIVGCWFGRASRGIILGIWSANASFGNIIGSLAVGGVLKYGYQYAYLVTSTMLFAGAIIIFFGLLTTPKEIGMEEANEGHQSASDKMAKFSSQAHLIDDEGNAFQESNTSSKSVALPFHKAILLPGVIPYALSYSCLKPVNYAFFFWLPFYLSSKFHWENSVSTQLSSWYDLGGIIGGIVFGYLSDRLRFRSPVMLIMLVISPITIFIYQESPNNKTINSLLMILIGIFLNGACSILSTAITADLGRQEAIKSDESALGTVTGFIDGSASFSAAIFQYIVPLINTHFGWQPVFYIFMVMTVLAIVSLASPVMRDYKQWKSSRNSYASL